MRVIAMVLLLCLLPLGSLLARPQEGSRTKEEFLKYAADRLGTEDKEFFERLFKAVDTNADGVVSADEFAKRQEALRKLRGGGKRPAPARPAERNTDDKEADFLAHSRRAAPRDSFPVLDSPKLTPAADAKLDDTEPVIGVVVGGEARAYSVAVMGRHELANDVCGKVLIAVSW